MWLSTVTDFVCPCPQWCRRARSSSAATMTRGGAVKSAAPNTSGGKGVRGNDALRSRLEVLIASAKVATNTVTGVKCFFRLLPQTVVPPEHAQVHYEQRPPRSSPAFWLHRHFPLPVSAAHHGIGATDRHP